MQPHAAERRHLERQIAYARPIFMVLALGDLLQRPPQDRGAHAVLFVLVYLGVAVGLVLFEFVPALSALACSACGGHHAALARFPASDAFGCGLLVPLSFCGVGGRDSLGTGALDRARRRGDAGHAGARYAAMAVSAGWRCCPGSRWRWARLRPASAWRFSGTAIASTPPSTNFWPG